MNSKESYQQFLKTSLWYDLSETCKRKAGFRCKLCGRKERLQAHHVYYRDTWEETKIEDLVCVCPFCHSGIHGKTFEAKVPDYLIERAKKAEAEQLEEKASKNAKKKERNRERKERKRLRVMKQRNDSVYHQKLLREIEAKRKASNFKKIQFVPIKGWMIRKSGSYWEVYENNKHVTDLWPNGTVFSKNIIPEFVALKLKQFVIALKRIQP